MFPHEFIVDVSPNSGWIRHTAKLPMVFMLISSGIMGGIGTSVFKLIGELAVLGEFSEQFWFVLSLAVPSMCANFLSLYFINVAMKYYD